MKNVNYKSLRRFEIGHVPTNPGYQTNKEVVSTNAFQSNAGYDMRGDTQAVRSSILPSALTGLSSMGNAAMNFAQNYTTEAAAKAAQAAGNTAAKAGMNTLGKAVSIAGALYGTGSMIKDFVDFSDRLHGNDLENMAATSTATKNGVAYKSIDGFNEAEAMRYTNAQNTQGTLSAALNGASAGMSAGSLGGPWGMAIGAVAGGLTGLFGGLFGSSKRKEKVEQDILATKGLHYGANTQNESEAGSKGLRNQFYGNADSGKAPGQTLGGSNYGMIQTPSGPTYGKIEGLASPDEGQIDMATGETQYNGSKNMNVIDRRADVIPVGITGYANGGAFDQNVGIPGHQLDINGRTFADNARPLFKMNEQLKDASRAIDAQLEQNDSHKTRDKVTRQYIANKLNSMKQQIQDKYQQNAQGIANIVNRQTAVLNGNMYSCGKTPKYADGKITAMDLSAFKPFTIKPQQTTTNADTRTTGPGDVFNSLFGVTDAGVGPGWSVAQALPYAIGETLEANKHTPYAQNSFVANPTAPAALRTLGSLRYDPTNQLNQLRTATRQGLYNINNAGSLSAGQRAALASSSNIAAAQAANSIYDKAQEINNSYKAQYADALMKYGQDEASRLQQANAYQQEAYRQAVGAQQKLKAQARKNWYTLGRQALQDYNTMLNTRGMMNLWNAQLGNNNAQPTNDNTSTATTKQAKLAQKAAQKQLKKEINYTKATTVKRQSKKGRLVPPDALPDYRAALQIGGPTSGVEEFNYIPWQKPVIRPGSDLWLYHYGD